jgi:hypothetical protein
VELQALQTTLGRGHIERTALPGLELKLRTGCVLRREHEAVVVAKPGDL